MDYKQDQHISQILKNKKISMRPRFTIIHHPIREKFGLSFSTYAVIDSIHQLSHRPDHPWCTSTKDQLANFLDIARRSVHRAIVDALEKGLIEKNDRGDLRTTDKWLNSVVLYDERK